MAYTLADGCGSGCRAGYHDHGYGGGTVNASAVRRVNDFLLHNRFQISFLFYNFESTYHLHDHVGSV